MKTSLKDIQYVEASKTNKKDMALMFARILLQRYKP